MEEFNLAKVEAEVAEIEKLPPVCIEISPLQVLGMITLIQAAAIQTPGMADHGWGKIGIEAARQLQSRNFFSQYPEVCKVLDFGWNPENFLVTPEFIAAMLLDIESRRSEQNKTSDKDGDIGFIGFGETVCQRIARSILESQGYSLDI